MLTFQSVSIIVGTSTVSNIGEYFDFLLNQSRHCAHSNLSRSRTFAPDGLMQKRHMSGNEISITEADRWFREGVDVDQVEIAERDG